MHVNSLNKPNMTYIFPMFCFYFWIAIVQFHLWVTEVLVPRFLELKTKDFLFRRKLSCFLFLGETVISWIVGFIYKLKNVFC